MQYYLKMLLESMPYLMKQQQQRPMGNAPPQGGQRHYQGGKPGGPNMRAGGRQYNQMGGNRGPMHA